MSANDAQARPRDPVTAWAKDVCDGRVVAGPYVRAAAARHLKDIETAAARGLKWDLRAALHAVEFFPRMLRLNGGQFEGRAFDLHPSQVFRVGSLFGWKRSDTGKRRFTRFYDEEGKGNGKSPLAAGIGLYMLVADGEARAEVYAAASKKDQAQVLFRDAVAMRDQSPALKKVVNALGENPVWQLNYRGKRGDRRWFKPISAESGQSGPRPHCALCDEVHEHRNRDVIDMLEAGFKFRNQPLLVMTTNSGTDRKSICWEEHQHAINVATGAVDDDKTFAFVCALDEGDDWEKDPSCWVKVNPLLGHILTEDYLAEKVKTARQIPGKKNGIARLHFCQWTEAVTAAISREAWAACHDDVDPNALTEAGYPCYGGLDLSQVKDFTAFTLTWVIDATKGAEQLASYTWFWTPADTLQDRSSVDQAPYHLWVEQGYCEAVPGSRLKYAWLAHALGQLNAAHSPVQVACDQYGLERLTEHLDDLGVNFPAIIHPQGFQKKALGQDDGAPDDVSKVFLWMPDSINKMEELIADVRLKVAKNPLLDSMAASTTYAENRTGARMFDKQRAHGRIDGMVSKAMSIGIALAREVEAGPVSPWDDEAFTLEGAF